MKYLVHTHTIYKVKAKQQDNFFTFVVLLFGESKNKTGNICMQLLTGTTTSVLTGAAAEATIEVA